MSIALENNTIGQVSGNGFMGRNKLTQYKSLSILDPGDHKILRVDERKNGSIEPCSSSSSIGKNSDDEEINDDDEEEEVQSKLKKNTFDSSVDALEQALPIRRGISEFYNGKSKSFASLSDATCSSIKDIAKPENPYTRKRKNLLAYSLLYDKGRTSLLKSPGIGGGITKRPIHTSRSTLPLAIAMSSSESSIDENGSRTPSVSPPTSPLPPAPWRSFSVADLQYCTGPVKSNFPSPLMGKNSKPDEVA